MPLSGKDVEGSSMSKGGSTEEEEEDDELEPPTIEVIHIKSTKTIDGRDALDRQLTTHHSPDGSRLNDDSQLHTKKDTKEEKKSKWKKMKSGLVEGTRALGSRLRRPVGGGGRKDVVQEICIRPSTGINGECFAEENKEEKEVVGRGIGGGRRRKGRKMQRKDSDDSLVFASRRRSATDSPIAASSASSSAKSRSSQLLTPGDSSSNHAVDASIVIYDADYDGQL